MDSIVEKVKIYCLQLLNNSRCKTLPYHNVSHTLEVFENVETIGTYEEIDKREMEILKIAALFHDTGFAETYLGHEDISIRNAQEFLRNLNYPEEHLGKVVNCINATRIPQKPISKLDKIICDADLFHLSSADYFKKNDLLRAEWDVYLDLKFTDGEWKRLNIDFLKKHTYHTDFGKRHLAKIRQKNAAKMESGDY